MPAAQPTTPAKPATTPDAPDFYDVTVTVKMTAEQRNHYAIEYGMDLHEVAADVRGRLQNEVHGALQSSYWLREFTSYSASEPR